jgi:3'-phosphoadenosine 5'-phosphosulfate sulfotransferase (PAPS reductase)/FAD synthetase
MKTSVRRAAGRGDAEVLFLPIFVPVPPPAPSVDPTTYDRVVVAFSGGKDSVACVLALLEAGVDRRRIELWHHLVDGREGSTLMDWPCTEAYVRAFADALGLAVFFSWREGGFEREMLRQNARTAPIRFETPDGTVGAAGGRTGTRSTRRKYPQTSADLQLRWCSGWLKCHVAAAALRNQNRFRSGRTLFVTGERAAESPNRARYAAFEPHEADLRTGHTYQRHIDRWRAVHSWSEADVWAIAERWRINPHPAYRLGFGRVSCALCIFASDHQIATIFAINPGQAAANARYETEFGHTIHRSLSLLERQARGRAFRVNEADVSAALATTWSEPIILPTGAWRLPAGAFGEAAGPP